MMKYYISDIFDEVQLTAFLLQDDYTHYLTIGIDFSPDDTRLSKEKIISTIIQILNYCCQPMK